MLLFFLFLSFVIGLLASAVSPFLLILSAVSSGIYYLRFRNRKEIFFLFGAALLGFLLYFLYPKGTAEVTAITGICIKRKENYCEFLTLYGKYYIYDQGKSLSWLEIAKITGSVSDFSFSHHESGFDFPSFLKSEGVYKTFTLSSAEKIFAFDFGSGLSEYLFSYLDDDAKVIADAFLFGGSITDLDAYEALSNMSLSSALALSGFHLSFLLVMLKKIMGRKHSKAYEIVELVLIFVFVLLSGFRYSMRRILILHSLSLVNRKKNLQITFLDMVSLTGMIMLFFEPYSVLSSSFLYSFPFLVFLAMFHTKRENNLKSTIGFMLFIYAFYLPFRLMQNYQLNIFSLPLSLLLLPISHILFLLSLFLVLCPPLGVVVNVFCDVYLSSVTFIYQMSDSWVTGMPSIVFLILFYLMLFLIEYMKIYHYRNLIGKGAVCLALLTSTLFIPDIIPHYEVTFIDVDQGDSTLVRYGYTDFLIDTGGRKNVDIATDCLIPYFRKRKISKLDAVIITHLDYDHYGALESLNANFTIDHVYYAEDFLASGDYTIAINDLPVKNLNDMDTDDSNEGSGVYSFTIKGKRFLIMGDASKETEAYLLEQGTDVDADYIKIGHHGSNTSSSSAFLYKVSPELAIISCGKNNSYGHPHQETLDTLNQLNIPYRRTDEEGSIQLLL